MSLEYYCLPRIIIDMVCSLVAERLQMLQQFSLHLHLISHFQSVVIVWNLYVVVADACYEAFDAFVLVQYCCLAH